MLNRAGDPTSPTESNPIGFMNFIGNSVDPVLRSPREGLAVHAAKLLLSIVMSGLHQGGLSHDPVWEREKKSDSRVTHRGRCFNPPLGHHRKRVVTMTPCPDIRKLKSRTRIDIYERNPMLTHTRDVGNFGQTENSFHCDSLPFLLFLLSIS